MHSGFFTRLGVWLFAALIAWAATLWASGELEDSLQVMRVQLRQYVTFESPRAHRRVGVLEELDTSFHEADTTAVVLNWSRFSNVLEIASTLCSPSLERVIAEVFIWNNNPSPISYDDFAGTGCSRSKLRIHNSAENLYFQARFIACSQTKTKYCFMQDDDYLVVPEVIHTLHARIQDTSHPHTIHLLPPLEHLSSTLREIQVGGTADVRIRTSFAWLGHGAILHRSEAADFMDLMRHTLNASDAELKMADNYYTILSNRVPEIWFDQSIELGGGQPFTVGQEGDNRNNRHVLRATEYLAALLRGSAQPPYVSRDPSAQVETSVARAACRGARCMLETNIALLPRNLVHVSTALTNILDLEADNRDRLNNDAVQIYRQHSPSRAVDDHVETYFQSLYNAAAADYILLDYLRLADLSSLRMVVLVSRKSQVILEASELDLSADGLTWYPTTHVLTCQSQTDTMVQRCSLDLLPENILVSSLSALPVAVDARFVRLRLTKTQEIPWQIHEIYLEYG